MQLYSVDQSQELGAEPYLEVGGERAGVLRGLRLDGRRAVLEPEAIFGLRRVGAQHERKTEHGDYVENHRGVGGGRAEGQRGEVDVFLYFEHSKRVACKKGCTTFKELKKKSSFAFNTRGGST